ncbi:MAG: hypothetical protein QOF16_1776 [Actinomycetota bacterium]|nr:hypothetical protein [Actinomycetota bacterium]
MSLDAKKDFGKDPQRVALIPSDEHIEAVIRATPEGQGAARGSGAEMRLGAVGVLLGAAARKYSARDEPEVVDGLSARWPEEESLYWIVLTDRTLRVYGADKKHFTVTDPNGAAFTYDEVDRLDIGQSFVVKPMRFVFTDGSAVTVDCTGMKTDDFTAAARRRFRGGVKQGQKDTSGLWVFAWLGIFGLMLGALATGAGAQAEGGTGAAILSVIATLCALGAMWWWIARWGRVGWKRWGVALALFILGAIVTAASFDKEGCDCVGMIPLGASLAVTGLVALGGRVHRRVLARNDGPASI